jgi:PKD domain/Bacterial Ig-like domain
LTKLTSQGLVAFSTRVGGSASESGQAISLNVSGDVFVGGSTDSPDFGATANAYQARPVGSHGVDAFVARYPANGGPANFVSVFGGAGDDHIAGVVTGSDGNLYVAGWTTSIDLPIAGAPQRAIGGGIDGFVAGLSMTTPTLLFSTFLGGRQQDLLFGIAESRPGRLTVSGMSLSSDYPLAAPVQPGRGGGSDGVVSEFDLTDTQPPQTEVSSGPSDPSPGNSAKFTFRAPNENAVTYECAIDDAVFEACVSPIEYRALDQGTHTFYVRASDASNYVEQAPVSYSWAVDADPPETTIAVAPPSVSPKATVELQFSSDQAQSSFECALDGGTLRPCAPIMTFADLAEGSHSVVVRATDPAGNTDTSPASVTWSVDLTPPTTSLTTSLLKVSPLTTAIFRLASPDTSATFLCALDDGDAAPCTSPAEYAGLGEGVHRFTAFAVDEAGNDDKTGASYQWRIETAPPSGRVDEPLPGLTNQRTVDLHFSANEPATFKCRVDDKAFAACESPKTFTDLDEGEHTFEVKATDLSGKPDPDPPVVSWRIDLTPPTAPALASPADGAPAERQLPTFAWEPATDQDSAMESYTLLIDGAPATPVPASDCSDARCSAAPPAALADGPHTWSVRSREAAGNTTSSPTRTFTVDAAGPSAPDAQEPVSDTVVAAAQAGLRWRASTDPGSGLASYAIAIDGQARATGLPAATTSWTTDGELANGRHEWSVTAIDRNGNRTTGATGSFIIDRTAPVASFTTVPPRPYYVDQTITFDGGGSEDPGGRIVRYDWDLDGDGAYEQSDAGPVIAHTYNVKEAGPVAVSLRVTDQARRATSTTQVIELSSTRPGATIVSLAGRADFTRFPKVNLRISPPSGATAMQISNQSGAFGAAVTRPITKAVEIVEGWDLAPFGDPTRGTPTTTAAVYVTFLAGPIPLPGNYSGQIGVDNRAPIVTAPKVATKGAYPLLKADVTDKAGSGVARVQVTTSKKQPGKQAFYALPPGSGNRINVRVKFVKGKASGALEIRKGAKKVYMRVEDALGNRSTFVPVTITKSGQIKKITAKKSKKTKKKAKQ